MVPGESPGPPPATWAHETDAVSDSRRWGLFERFHDWMSHLGDAPGEYQFYDPPTTFLGKAAYLLLVTLAWAFFLAACGGLFLVSLMDGWWSSLWP